MNMAPQDTIDDRNISLTAHQPRHIINGMIKITEPAKPSGINRTSTSSSLGNMEVLPLELLHAILAMLNFKSLFRMTRTCSRGMAVVKSLPEYNDLMRHAPAALTALGKTGSIRHHSAATIHTALISADCTSCQNYGAFLFLPTCQRCCYHCLRKNQSLWVMPIAKVKKCFGLSIARTKTLPTIRGLPGKYHAKFSIFRLRSIRLVCVGTAKRLALEEHGSEEQMRKVLEGELSTNRFSEEQCYQFRHLQRAPLLPPGPHFHMQPMEANSTNDVYCGMASVPFPYLAPGKKVENGLWCLGCENVASRWPFEDLDHLLSPDGFASDMVNMMPDIARLREKFLSHIDTCPGAQGLIKSAVGKSEYF